MTNTAPVSVPRLFRKKPVEIEAVQVTAADWNGATWDGCPFKGDQSANTWLIEAMRDGILRPVLPNGTDYAEWEIKTLEGTMLATPGDWIIRGIKGELYPCKPDIFAMTYELAAAPVPPIPEGGESWKCKARTSSLPDPQDCDWPQCGCDPIATKVLDDIEASGFEIVRRDSIPKPVTAEQVERVLREHLSIEVELADPYGHEGEHRIQGIPEAARAISALWGDGKP